MTQRIKSVKFEDSNHRYGDKEVLATMEDGSELPVFHFFSDELHFDADELVGLTVKEAGDLKQRKDIAYLRS